jgi:hypothetical protein
MDRAALEARWLTLTRDILPGLARDRGWPVHQDHCFQRILLDNACGGRWYDFIVGRPAYRSADPELLLRAVELGEACIKGTEDLSALNRRSLDWRKSGG